MNREEALSKIKKCLALAASPNAHEAAAALRQAQKLMAAFDISGSDVDLADVAEFAQTARNTPLVYWETMLVNLICDAFGVTHFTCLDYDLSRHLRVRRRRQFVFIGVGAAPEVAGYAFDVLARQCARDRRAYMRSQPGNCKRKTLVARGDRYAEGWVAGVRDKVTRHAGDVSHTKLVAQYMTARYPDLKTARPHDRVVGKNTSSTDWHRGVAAGRDAELNHAMDGRGRAPLLEGGAA